MKEVTKRQPGTRAGDLMCRLQEAMTYANTTSSSMHTIMKSRSDWWTVEKRKRTRESKEKRAEKRRREEEKDRRKVIQDVTNKELE